jgi:Calcineurin-like phosphoesterase
MIRGMRSRFHTLVVATLLAATTLTAVPAGQSPAARVVAIGDIHGAFDPFVQILQSASLIDANKKWSGGTAVFVQTGDVFDRGAGVIDALDLLMRLEGEASRAGGRVEALLGNHEVMNLVSEFRDVTPDSYAPLADGRSEDRRKRAYDDYLKVAKRREGKGDPIEPREEWMKSHPPGFLEYVDALSPRGKYGKWLRSHKAVVKIGRTAFMHAGLRPDPALSIDQVNATVAREIATWDDTKAALVQAQLVTPFCTLKEAVSAAVVEIERIAAAIKEKAPLGDHVTRDFVDRLQALVAIDKSPLFAGDGPLWFRGYAQWPESPENEAQVTTLLKQLDLDRFVTGHTPLLPTGRITPRFNQRLVLIDTGMLSTYFKGGRASALEIQDKQLTAIYVDGKETLVPGMASLLRQ